MIRTEGELGAEQTSSVSLVSVGKQERWGEGKENHKHRLENLVSGVGILQRVLDLRHTEEHVAPAGSPQHLLEGGQAPAQDDSGHEPQLEAATRTAVVLNTVAFILAPFDSQADYFTRGFLP